MKYTYKQTRKDKDLIEYEVTIDFAEYKTFVDQAYSKLSKDVVIPGFRPGKGPKEAIEAKLGTKLLDEAIRNMLPIPAVEIIEKDKMKPVAQLQYDLHKFDPKEGIIYKFSFTNFPEVKLGDFKKIKVEKKVEKVSDEDVDSVIRSILRSGVKPEVLKKYEVKPKSDNKDAEKTEKKTSSEETKVIDFELNDELVKELKYKEEKTLDELRKSVKERLEGLKNEQMEEQYRNNIVEEALKITNIEIPESFIRSEAEAYENDFKARLSNLNLNVDTYLQTQNTTLEKKREEWKKMAEDKVKIDILLISVAMEYNLVPENKDIDAEIEAISDQNLKKQYDTDRGREMIRTVLTRRKGVNKLVELVEGKK